MKSEKDDFRFESYQDKETVIKYLTALKDGFEKDEIILRTAKNDLKLKPGGLIHFKILSEHRENRKKLVLSFSWKEED